MTKLPADYQEPNPIGYTVNMYLAHGGSVGFWKPSLKEALQEIKHWKTQDGYIIVKTPYQSRVKRHVINHAKNLDDAGIYSRKTIRRKSQA